MDQKETLSVFGLGKLGATMLSCFAHKGWNVIGVDVIEENVKIINDGHSPVSEPHVDDLINIHKDKIQATMDAEYAVLNSDASFIIVPTPSQSDGLFSTKYVEAVCKDIAEALKEKDNHHIIVITSTVLMGDTERIGKMIEEISGKKMIEDFGLAYNPEFIALGKIVKDFLNPDMVLIGESDEWTGKFVESIHERLTNNKPSIHRMNFYNAELSKISLNAFCTVKITFANTIAEICEKLPDGDSEKVLQAIGSDTRIGNKYFKGGLGFAGPCLKPNSLIQTDRGLKEIQNIVIGDKVFTHRGRLRKVTKIFKRPYTGLMEKIISMGFPYSPMILTPDHPVWGSKRVQRTKNKYRVVSTTGQRRLGPAAGLGKLEFIPAFKVKHGDLMALPLINEKDIKIPTLKFDLHWLNKIPARIKLNIEIMKFFGFFISEGSTWKNEIKITLHKKEIHYAEDLVRIIKIHFNSKAQIKPHHENCIKVKFHCTPLALYLKETFGHNAQSKRVPFDWLFLPEEFLIELLRGIWYGDGSKSTDRFTYGTISHKLHRFLQLSLLRLGITFAIKSQEERIDKNGVKHQKAYFLNISNGLNYSKVNKLLPDLEIKKIPKGSKSVWIEEKNMLCTVRSVEEESYKGIVYNLEVQEDNSYMLESGVVHNCFPRDNRALFHSAEKYGIDMLFCKHTDNINNYHKTARICKLIIDIMAEKETDKLAILGLAYKEDTPIIEESVAIEAIKLLSSDGIKVTAYDPEAMEEAKKELGETITFADSAYSCLENHSICFIATPWKEFSELRADQILEIMAPNPIILDAWGILNFGRATSIDEERNILTVRRIGKNYK